MSLSQRPFHVLGFVLLSAALSACAGSGANSLPGPGNARSGQSAGAVAGAARAAQSTGDMQTLTVPLARDGSAATLSLPTGTLVPGVSVTGASGASEPDTISQSSTGGFLAIPPIVLTNNTGKPITIPLHALRLTLPHCDVNGKLFGVSFYQVSPVPPVNVSTKIGDATGTDHTIVFEPIVNAIVLAPNSVSNVAIAQEESTADVTLRVTPGVPTQLTSNASNVPSNLSFVYSNATGGSVFGSACFLAHDASGNLVPDLQSVAIVGTPSYYCNLDPGSNTITFGQTVQFTISSPKPDRSILGLDGPSTYACTPGAPPNTCNTQQFTLPAVQRAIVGNVRDLTLCVPATPDTDCNGVNGSQPPPPSTNQVLKGKTFQLLVADDGTYAPGTAFKPVPWDGLFRIAFSGPCTLDTKPDNDNGDVPPSPFPGQPGYSDSGQNGVGPYAEFDIDAKDVGTCTITVSEDPKYIIDDSNPSNPVGRSATLAIGIVKK